MADTISKDLFGITLGCSEACLTSIRAHTLDQNELVTRGQYRELNAIYSRLHALQQEIACGVKRETITPKYMVIREGRGNTRPQMKSLIRPTTYLQSAKAIAKNEREYKINKSCDIFLVQIVEEFLA